MTLNQQISCTSVICQYCTIDENIEWYSKPFSIFLLSKNVSFFLSLIYFFILTNLKIDQIVITELGNSCDIPSRGKTTQIPASLTSAFPWRASQGYHQSGGNIAALFKASSDTFGPAALQSRKKWSTVAYWKEFEFLAMHSVRKNAIF